ncbi:MAG: dihydroorotate dehydrogenase [Candidatus Margulisiibacteriota bacterium]
MAAMMRAAIFLWVYPKIRSTVKAWTQFVQRLRGEVPDLEATLLAGHWFLKRLSGLRRWLFAFDIPKGIGVEVGGLYFPSPLILAAFEGDIDVVGLWMGFGLGGGTLKTILKDPRPGNPRPRIQEIRTPAGLGLINAMGLPGKGVSAFLASLEVDLLAIEDDKPIGLSIGGHSVAEYIENLVAVDVAVNRFSASLSKRFYYELNISCPNTPDGQNLLKHPELLVSILQAARAQTTRLISVKLSPDQSDADLLQFATLIRPFPNLALTLGNTQYRRCADLGLPESAISVGGGGLSGPELYARTLAMVQLLAPFGLPMIATGGVSGAEQVKALQAAGASLVGVATAVVQNPYRIPIINAALK